MKPTIRLLAQWSVFALATYAATSGISSQEDGFSVTNVSVVDVTSGEILSRRTVTINGNKISAVTEATPGRNATVIDGTGKFLIPGLWDMYAHIQGNENAWLPLYVANGVYGTQRSAACSRTADCERRDHRQPTKRGGGFTHTVRRASKGASSLTRLWTDEPTPAFCRGVELGGRE